jgi:uncharacterized protein (TIGR00369 family)
MTVFVNDLHPSVRHYPDPDHPGWFTWDLPKDGRFHNIIGRMLVQPAGEGRGRCRIFPDESHTNMGGMLHGGAVLTFIDMALFAGGRVAGADTKRAVTLDCATQFLSPGRPGLPLDAEVELLRETGRLAFFRGLVVQEGEIVASFTGTLRKFSRKQ